VVADRAIHAALDHVVPGAIEQEGQHPATLVAVELQPLDEPRPSDDVPEEAALGGGKRPRARLANRRRKIRFVDGDVPQVGGALDEARRAGDLSVLSRVELTS